MPSQKPHRTARLTIRLTEEERGRIVRRAEQCGMTLSRYVRRTALGAVPRARPRRVDRQAVAQLNRLGNNLNQLARVANTTGRLAQRGRLRRLVRQIEAIVRELTE